MTGIAALTDPAGREILHADLTDPRLYAFGDPEQIWRRMRKAAPVGWQRLPNGRGFWVITSHLGARQVLEDPGNFTSEQGAMLSALERPDPAGNRQMILTDPPLHTVLHEPLQRKLSPLALKALTPQIRTLVRRMLAPGLGKEKWDIGAAVSTFPAAIAGLLMGLGQPESLPQLARWSTMAIAPEDPEFQIEADPRTTLGEAHRGIFTYFAEEVVRRSQRVGGEAEAEPDLIDCLMSVELNGEPLATGDLIANCYSILLGANITTGYALTSAVYQFAHDHALYRACHRAWSTSPRLLHAGVEEILRRSSPVLHVLRHARRDTMVEDVKINGGDAITVWLPAANHDATVFSDPEKFVIDRRPNPHVTFGAGPHYCIGAVVARLSLRVAMEELFELADHIELAEPPSLLQSNFVNGVKHLSVTVHAR